MQTSLVATASKTLFAITKNNPLMPLAEITGLNSWVLPKPIIRPTICGKNKECINVRTFDGGSTILLYFVLCLTRNVSYLKMYSSVQTRSWMPRIRVEILLYCFFNFRVRLSVWSTPLPSRLSPWERNPVPILHEACWAAGPVWKSAENLTLTGVRSLDCPVRTDWAVPAHRSVRVD
jgi:hypothetical protein